MLSDGKKLVSIVIPVYNPDKEYFISLLDSIRSQTYKNFEIIISDDNSGEDILTGLNLFDDLPIVYIKNKLKNKGIFSNLNNAIKYAKGDFIQIFCQDDIMTDKLLESQLKKFEISPRVGMVYCDFESIDSNGVTKDSADESYKKLIPDYIESGKSYQYFTSFGCLPGNLSPVMLRRKVIKESGAFNPEYYYAGDFEYWVRLSQKFDIVYNKDVLCKVRSHKNRASISLSRKDLGLTGQLFSIYNNLVRHYPLESHPVVSVFVQRTVGIYQLHDWFRMLFRFKINVALKGVKNFKGVFNFWSLLYYYIPYRVSKKRFTQYPIIIF